MPLFLTSLQKIYCNTKNVKKFCKKPYQSFWIFILNFNKLSKRIEKILISICEKKKKTFGVNEISKDLFDFDFSFELVYYFFGSVIFNIVLMSILEFYFCSLSDIKNLFSDTIQKVIILNTMKFIDCKCNWNSLWCLQHM